MMRHTYIFALVFCAIVLVWARPAMAEPRITSRDQFYDVRGTTKDEVWRDLLRKSHGGGGSHAAWTEWKIHWSYTTHETSEGCRISDILVREEIVCHLPRWIDDPGPKSELGKDWARFQRALTVHEEGHRKIAIEAARMIEKEMREAAIGDCLRLKSAVDKAANRTYAEYRKLGVQYDRDTRHGITQGTIF